MKGLHLGAACLLIAVCLMPGTAGAAADTRPMAADELEPYVAGRLTYDDNLYRLPSATTVVATTATPGATREDRISTGSLGIRGTWVLGRQFVDFNLRVDRNRFAHNDVLNNTSHDARTALSWIVGRSLSGHAGLDFTRALSDFASSRFRRRDLVDALAYFVDAGYELGPRWTLIGDLREQQITHSASQARINNYHSRSTSGGAQYTTAAKNVFTWEYRYTEATFPPGFLLNDQPFNEDFRESMTRFRLQYALSGKTFVDAFVGYLRRGYPYATTGAFSGDDWNVSLRWQPSSKLKLTLTGWRELQANLDSQSDYFVARGQSVLAAWTYSRKLSISLTGSWDDEKYIAASSSVLVSSSRHDNVTAQQVNVIYKSTPSLAFDLAYRHEDRSSNLPLFKYGDNLANANIMWSF
jgi:Putative beta-barrel porin 2